MGSSQTRAQTRVPCIGRRIRNHCATREAPGIDISFLPGEWTKLTQLLLFHFWIRAHPPKTLYLFFFFFLTESKEGLKGKRTMGCPIFHFPSMASFLVNVWLIYELPRSLRKDVIGFLGVDIS